MYLLILIRKLKPQPHKKKILPLSPVLQRKADGVTSQKIFVRIVMLCFIFFYHKGIRPLNFRNYCYVF